MPIGTNRCNELVKQKQDIFIFLGNLQFDFPKKNRGHVHRSPLRDVLLHGSRGGGVVRDSCAPNVTAGLCLEVRRGELSLSIMREWCLAAVGRSRGSAV